MTTGPAVHHSTRDELFLGPVHTFTVDHGQDTRGTLTLTHYTRTVEGWTRTTEKNGPATGHLNVESAPVRSSIARVVDTVAHDRDALSRLVGVEQTFTTGDRRRRAALHVALSAHGLALANA